VADLFRDYLATPAVPASLRVAATEALANSTPDAVPFLAGLAGADAEAEVRAAAAWAISIHQSVTDLAPALTLLAERETDEDVRRRLYEALLPQQDIAGDRLLPLVLAEDDIAARVAGFNALGTAARQQPASAAAATFDSTVVPELMRIATNPNSLNIQMRAVFALRRAQTPAAQAALTTISQQAPPQVAAAARHGLPATNG
jgi:HEAT repeat protein